MSPPSPTRASKPQLIKPRAFVVGRFIRIALVGGLLCCSSATPAGADKPANSSSSQPETTPVVSPKSPTPSPLPPQTRYTVRKQIESIEPVAWLESYGTVRIRDLDR
jgi:hypothetical protein